MTSLEVRPCSLAISWTRFLAIQLTQSRLSSETLTGARNARSKPCLRIASRMVLVHVLAVASHRLLGLGRLLARLIGRRLALRRLAGDVVGALLGERLVRGQAAVARAGQRGVRAAAAVGQDRGTAAGDGLL